MTARTGKKLPKSPKKKPPSLMELELNWPNFFALLVVLSWAAISLLDRGMLGSGFYNREPARQALKD